MSLKPKPQTTEIDHIRNTLTDLVDSVGEGNNKIQQVQQHLLKHDQRFDQQDKELSQFKNEVRERFDQLELLIRQSLPKN